jgi:RHS repeat-associated protein
MLPQFALINMNGRMYDPLLGRMLSADNVIHDPTGTQSYNRYSYVSNNPLKYTDPTGWDDYDPYNTIGSDGGGSGVSQGAASFFSLIFGNSGGIEAFDSWSGRGSSSDFGTYSAADWANAVTDINKGEASPDAPIISTGKVLQQKQQPDGSWVIVYREDGTGDIKSVKSSADGSVYSFIDPIATLGAMVQNSSVSVYSYNLAANGQAAASNLTASAGGGDKSSNWATSFSLFGDWLAGNNGGRLFNNDDYANELLSTPQAHDALAKYYINGVMQGSEQFGLSDYFKTLLSGNNATLQFVGTFDYLIDDQHDPDNLIMIINNTTSFASFLGHIPSYSWNWQNGPMSNFNQTYIIFIPK